jgi:hypothetical protein
MLRLRTFTAAVLLLAATVDARQGPPPPDAAPPTANAVIAGELLIEPATLHNLGFEWFIQGDENRNGTVTVSFR